MTDLMSESDYGPDADIIGQIVTDVFIGLVGTDDDPVVPGDPRTHWAVAASVAIDGAWCGEVAVSCSAALARDLTARMLDTDVSKVLDEDVRDALGEVANVVGGSVKSIVPGPCALSLPQCWIDGDKPYDHPHRDHAGEELCVDLAWRDEPMQVRVQQFAQPPSTSDTREKA